MSQEVQKGFFIDFTGFQPSAEEFNIITQQPGGERGEEEVHPNIGGETAPTQMRATKNFTA